MNIRSLLKRTIDFLFYAIAAIIIVTAGYFLSKIFLFDVFPVNSYSMYPTIEPGDRIFVNKMIFGPRIYSNLRFLDGEKMESRRLKGLRRIKHNDIIVFNHSQSYDIQFKINRVYVKRCIALPGDSISISNGIYRNSSTRDSLGLLHLQEHVNDMEFANNVMYSYLFTPKFDWTIKNFGPYYIPRKGDIIEINNTNLTLYGRCMQYEQGDKLRFINDSIIMIGEDSLKHYRFETNYYFMSGDNVYDSYDSRYFGTLPEEFIIGVAPRIIYSKNRDRKARVSRVLKRI